MNGLQSLDISLFRFINSSLSNPVLDKLMQFLSLNPFYVPCLFLILAVLAWKGGVRGRLCAFSAVLAIAIGDGVLCNLLKHAVDRPRPFLQLDDVRVLVGRGASRSMPSSHAANSFALLAVFYVYYRRSIYITAPLAVLISFSRIYNGVHFPSDVLAGAILGAGYTLGGIWTVNEIWRTWGRKYFTAQPGVAEEVRWLRLGYLVTGLLLLAQLAYLAAGVIELSEDEAYQWVWSKHPALSYYSKPPLIAWTQWLGTHLWGDTEFGVRFFSPVIAATLSIMVLRFLAAVRLARTGFWLIIVMGATPILASGSILMTIDPLLVLFWTAAMIAGWRAVQPEGRLQDWLWVGIWMGLGFLSKYTVLFQLVSWAAVFIWLPAARRHLRKPGPWLALFITCVCAVPVVIWNVQHNWITINHVANDGRLGQPWQPTLRYFIDFVFAETVLFNPFFVALLILAIIGWKRGERTALECYVLLMGAPVFVFYLLFTFHSRVLPNWIAPCILPFCFFGALRWDAVRRAWPRLGDTLLRIGLALGWLAVILLHDSGLLQKAVQRTLPPRADPLKRLRGWTEFAAALEAKRAELLKRGGEVFLIGDHYGVAGLMSFYVPEAKASITKRPLVYSLATSRPENQFYFWPDYQEQRAGQNAIFVQSIDSPGLVDGWFWKWLREGDSPGLDRPLNPQSPAPPSELTRQFRKIEDLGPLIVFHRERPFHYFHLYFCLDAQPAQRHE